MKIKLKKPVEFEGEVISELELNLDGLTGQDMIDAQRETGPNENPIQEFDKQYLSVLAAKACERPTDLMPHLSIKDFSKVTVEVQNFLFSEESEETPTLEK